jgi:hypothetical protein
MVTLIQTGDIFSSVPPCPIIGRDATAVIKTHNLIRGIPSNRIPEHFHGTVRDEKIWRSRKHLTASLSVGKHASLQGAATTRDLSPTQVGDVALWTTGGKLETSVRAG